jgi:phytoene/squalene synthetase
MSVFHPLQALDYCESQVKDKAMGVYLHGMFLPPEIRPFFYSIHALRIELIKSRENIMHSSLISTKQAWWLENLDSIWNSFPAQEPVSIAISELKKYHTVRKSHFERLIKGVFEEPQMKNLRAFDRYIDNNYTMCCYLTLEILHYFGEAEFEAITYAGRSWGIMELLLRTKYYAEQGRFYFPEDLLEKYKIPTNISKENEENHTNELPEQFYDLILEIAAYGRMNLEKARENQSSLPKYAYLGFLQLAQAEMFYKKLEQRNFNIFDAKTRKFSWMPLAWKMFKCARKKVF